MSCSHQVFLLLPSELPRETAGAEVRVGASEEDSAREEAGKNSALRGWAPAGER